MITRTLLDYKEIQRVSGERRLSSSLLRIEKTPEWREMEVDSMVMVEDMVEEDSRDSNRLQGGDLKKSRFKYKMKGGEADRVVGWDWLLEYLTTQQMLMETITSISLMTNTVCLGRRPELLGKYLEVILILVLRGNR